MSIILENKPIRHGWDFIARQWKYRIAVVKLYSVQIFDLIKRYQVPVILIGSICQKIKVIKSCELLEQAVEKRIEQWLQNAAVEQTHLVSHYIDQTEWREQVSMNVVALIFESLGIHFLQDSISGGHVRIDRAAHSLSMARYLHNEDSKNGVITTIGSRSGTRQFVAFGDGYLLTPQPIKRLIRIGIEWTTKMIDLLVCSISVTVDGIDYSASLADWVLGGSLYQQKRIVTK